MATAIEITDANFEEILNTDMPVIVDCWAEWCGPCKMLTPIIEELASDFDGKAVVGKLDVDTNQEVAMKFGIRSIPTVLFLKGGELQDKQVGLASKAQLADKINALV